MFLLSWLCLLLFLPSVQLLPALPQLLSKCLLRSITARSSVSLALPVLQQLGHMIETLQQSQGIAFVHFGPDARAVGQAL
jgi:hypothetical protein